MVEQALKTKGYAVFAPEPAVSAWADAAYRVGCEVLQGAGERRHGRTWFVGVDALPNATDGSVAGVPLAGAWLDHVAAPQQWHLAQLSVVFPGYPRRDADESDAAHRYRRNRDAAHVDGLLAVGPEKRRYLQEPHGFIVGFPLNDVPASPLVVWEGSHVMMRAAFAGVFANHAPDTWDKIDVTDVYQATRKVIFEACPRVEITARPGQAILLDRHLVHGVAPWGADQHGDMRMMAYFRPLIAPQDWL